MFVSARARLPRPFCSWKLLYFASSPTWQRLLVLTAYTRVAVPSVSVHVAGIVEIFGIPFVCFKPLW